MALKVSAKVPETFAKLTADLEGDRSHCAVIAIAAITRLPAKRVQEALAAAGRKPRCGTSQRIQRKALETLGFKVTYHNRTWIRKNIIDHYPGRHINLESATTHHPRRFRGAWSHLPDLLLYSRSHVAAYVDGVVVDWTIQHSKRIIQIGVVEKAS